MRMGKNKRKAGGILLTLCMLLSSSTVFADGVNPTGHTLYQYSQSEEMVQWFEENKIELLEEHKKKYPTENGWWDEYAIMPIETGVISGYPDGTIRPNNPVTGGEFAKMVATAFEGYIPSGGTLDSKSLNGKWYNNYYNVMAKAMPYPASGGAGAFLESPMIRSEVAYVIAKIIDSESLEAYITKVRNKDFSTMAGYVDFEQYVCTEDTYPSSWGTTYTVVDSSYICTSDMRKVNLIPYNQAAAIMMLKDLGIMVGDGAGHISPMGNVTRAEIFKLLNECCKATKDYKRHKFLGWENFGRDFYTDSERKALPWVYSLDQVINPEAEEKYQYTFGDLKWYDTTQAYYKSNQHLVMSGQHNATHGTEIYQKSLSEEYAKAVIDDVKNSYSREGNIIKFYLPDLKSKYHYIDVVFNTGNKQLFFNSMDNPGWHEINISNYSLRDTEWCELGIRLIGNGRLMYGESRYRVDINYVTGNIETREE